MNDKAESLRTWMHETDPETVDAVLEFLYDENLLNIEGVKVRENFWERYVNDE